MSALDAIICSTVKAEIPYGYCHCGCGELTTVSNRDCRTNGYVKGEPKPYIRGHQRRKSPVEYIVDPATGCWMWQRSTDRKGYGQLRIQNRLRAAHRVYYERVHGALGDMHLDHLCRTPACVNPDHLEPVTNEVNSQRGNRAKLTPDSVRQIRISADSPRALAERFNVALRTIYSALDRTSWKNV